MQTNPISFDAPGTVTDWLAINDAVMGGLSTGRFSYDPVGHAVFEGEVSLERNGGFASVLAVPGSLSAPLAPSGTLCR